ncbi:aminotransferase class III-fold pyridoxal phosphate-dependent enzyme, partial [Actinosynnema sp. NPDC023658]|uniref:aminotransferase class III-fold pyridoxal phosphate-dependent enzyme n=1 Tax=Actinosynnema sp. NPDC023658 TaxID=3155465 RepID=UPI0033F8B518
VLRVRGKGLMIGVDLDADADAVADLRLRCRDEGLLLSTAGSTVILTPPLVITAEDCAELVDKLDRSMRAVLPVPASSSAG